MKCLLPAIPVILGFLLDCIIGDPYSLPHPIRLIGKLIAVLEKLKPIEKTDVTPDSLICEFIGNGQFKY